MLRYAPKNMGSVKKKENDKIFNLLQLKFPAQRNVSHSHHMNMNLYLHCIFACNPMQPRNGQGKVFSRKYYPYGLMEWLVPTIFWQNKVNKDHRRSAIQNHLKSNPSPLKIQECAIKTIRKELLYQILSGKTVKNFQIDPKTTQI